MGQSGHRRTAGEKQIDYHEKSDQWVPRGDVLRCIIDDGGPEGEVTIHIDDKELSLAEFGRMLTVHAGWGMRIAFVPEEFHIRESKGRSPKAQATEALTPLALFGAGNAHFHFWDCQAREKDAAYILSAGHLADPS